MADDNQAPQGDENWHRIKGLKVDKETGGDKSAKGVVDLATTIEIRPCFACKSWEKDERKLAQHIRSKGLKILPSGTMQTPIAKDFKGRSGILMIPGPKGKEPAMIQDFGWCRRDSQPTHYDATCPNFNQVKRREDMRQRQALGDRLRLR